MPPILNHLSWVFKLDMNTYFSVHEVTALMISYSHALILSCTHAQYLGGLYLKAKGEPFPPDELKVIARDKDGGNLKYQWASNVCSAVRNSTRTALLASLKGKGEEEVVHQLNRPTSTNALRRVSLQGRPDHQDGRRCSIVLQENWSARTTAECTAAR